MTNTQTTTTGHDYSVWVIGGSFGQYVATEEAAIELATSRSLARNKPCEVMHGTESVCTVTATAHGVMVTRAKVV